ncbi:MAG: cupin domain-containing protein [Lachnospiraceae bacterium]|nr:cupin domain-containing protein [Lachnospiraceae bacterium]
MAQLYKRLVVDFEHKDARGKLSQLVHGGFNQVNVLETRAGVTRGGHYHKISREAFFVVSGSVKVDLKNEFGNQTEIFHKGDFFMVSPFTVHCMYFPEDCVMVVLYDIPVGDGGEDIFYSDPV